MTLSMNRIMQLHRMTKHQLELEERLLMQRIGMTRVYGGPGRKDEFISSIIDLETRYADRLTS